MKPTEEMLAAIDKFPAPDSKGGVLSTVDKKATDEAIATLHKGGPAAVAGVIDTLVANDPAVDSKSRHALHALVHHVCGLKDEAARATLAKALAAPIGGDKPKEVQAFLIHQVRLCGGKEVVPALAKVVLDEELSDPAIAALLSIKDDAATPLREAMPKAKGRMKLAIAQALGVLKDAESVSMLRAATKDEDRDTRIAACRSLAEIGDGGAADLLIKATAAEGWERTQAVNSCFVLAEILVVAGKKVEAAKLYRHLHDSRTDPKEAYVKDAAIRGLAAAGMKLSDTIN